jgi:hypothetical protein
MLLDRYGLSLSTSSAEAGRAYGEGVDRFLAAHAAPEDAFARGRHEDVIAALAPVVEQLVRVGGSAAQRDLFEHTLLAAYLHAGRAAHARALLARRVARQPSVPVAGAR